MAGLGQVDGAFPSQCDDTCSQLFYGSIMHVFPFHTPAKTGILSCEPTTHLHVLITNCFYACATNLRLESPLQELRKQSEKLTSPGSLSCPCPCLFLLCVMLLAVYGVVIAGIC